MKIKVPKSDSIYLNSDSPNQLVGLIGPFHWSGEPFQEVEIDDGLPSSFFESPGIYGQNSVKHSRIEANVTVLPFTVGARPLVWYGLNWALFPMQDIHSKVNMTNGICVDPLFEEPVVMPYQTSGWYRTYQVAQILPGNEICSAFFNAYMGPYREDSPDIEFICDEVVRKKIRVNQNGTYDMSYEVHRFVMPVKLQASLSEIPSILKSMFHQLLNREVKITETGQRFYNYNAYRPLDPGKLNMSAVKEWARGVIALDIYSDASAPVADYGDLVQAAAENINPNTINMIAFIKDLKDVKSLIPKLKNLGKMSTHASNYLGVEYGVLPTLGDLKSIWDSFRTAYFYDINGFQRASAYGNFIGTSIIDTPLGRATCTTNATRRVHLAINTKDKGLDAIVEKMRKIGVFPSLTNLWDLIPYSFVIDWFVDVGSVLESIDTRHQLLNLDIPYCIISDKLVQTYNLKEPEQGINASISVKRYVRNVQQQIPQPRIFKENRVTAQDHWIEGSALLLSRSKL